MASARLDFDRAGDSAAAADRLSPIPPAPTERMLLRVYDGGAMPDASGRVYLGRPATVSYDPSEGAGYAVFADSSRSVPFVVLGREPEIGDVLAAHRVGGIWIAEIGAPPNIVYCGNCAIPKGNLTLTWTNNLLGTHSAPMVFNGTDEWSSGCINQILFRLSCRFGAMTFTATYFVAGSCPTGQPVVCSSPGSSPIGLTLAAQSCDPLFLQYSPTPCPALAAQGYTKFTVTL